MKKIICIIMAMIFVLIPLSSCDSAGADGESQASSDSKAENISNVTESKDVISNSMNNLDNTPAAIGKIQFGLTPEELIAALKDNNMELEDPENMSDWTTGMQVSVSNPVDDGRVYYSHDGLTFFVYETKGGDLVFEYDENGKAFSIFTDTSAYTTDKGAKVGDTVSKIKEIYGSDFYKGSHDGPENEVYYRYEQNGAYVIFEIYNSTDNDSDTVSRIYISASNSPFGD